MEALGYSDTDEGLIHGRDSTVEIQLIYQMAATYQDIT